MITARHLVDAIDLQNRFVEQRRGAGEEIGNAISEELGVDSTAFHAMLHVVTRDLVKQFGWDPSQVRELAGIIAAFQIGVIAAREERDGREG